MSDLPEPSIAAEGGESEAAQNSLQQRLREAGEEELLALLRAHATELAPPDLRHALRNPFCTAEAIEQISGEQRLLSFYEVRRDLTLHPRTPETLAARFVPTLYWRDLMVISLDSRLRPALRRAAEIHLAARLPGMAVGEKVSLARRASPGVIAQLRHDPSPPVIAALLDNSRLTEGALAPVVHAARTPPAILELIAGDRRWGVRYPLRLALVRNPATPLPTAWRLLETLGKADLRPVAADPRLAEPLRRRARVLLGDD